jgi:putative ABC transport system ATP-binding protein
MGALIELRGLVKSYSRGGETLRVLDKLDLDLEAGGFYALMGPSGSGKTTLLNLVGGLDRADEGRIVVDGEDIAKMSGPELADWRAERVGFVFQGFNLIPVLTAQENVELPLLLTRLSRAQRKEHARNSAWRSRARWSPTPCWCWPTSPRATSTASRRTTCWPCCGCSTRSTARRS